LRFVQKCGQHLDQHATLALISAIREIPGIIARKMPLTIRIVELLHTQPEIWMPYKEMCLPNRILSFLTMTSDELRDFLERPPISANPSEIKFLEGGVNHDKKVYAQCVQVMGQLLSLVLPNIDVDSEEITWAYTVMMSRSIQTPEEVLRGGGPGQLIPLFDMMNHAARPACDLAQHNVHVKPGERARLAAQAADWQALSSDVSDMPWVCPQFCVAAVSQKLLPYNIIALKHFKIKTT
jgi:hypothetical protein